MSADIRQKDLRERTLEYPVRVVKLYGALPKSVEAQGLGKQFLRSGTSAGANYRKAHRARSDADWETCSTVLNHAGKRELFSKGRYELERERGRTKIDTFKSK